jgi:probable phosphoglycerate mutase
LNARGLEQAEALAEALQTTRFDAIVASDLARARVTARAVADRTGQDVALWPLLRERTYGPFEGLTPEQFRQQDPASYQRFRTRDPQFDLHGGESLETLAQRARLAMERLTETFLGQRILVVTHGGIIDVVHRLIVGETLHEPRTFPIENCAMHWLSYAEARWQIDRWGDHDHLSETRDEMPEA